MKYVKSCLIITMLLGALYADTWGDENCSYEDTDADGYDDVSYDAGVESVVVGDVNGDETYNVMEIVILANCVLYQTEFGACGSD